MKTNINPLSKERRICERAIELIKVTGNLNKNKLNFQLGITTKNYERLHPFLRDNFEDKIQYDKVDGAWKYIGKK